ncbi:MAG TPA: ATP-binding cassette domain-containing protein, partial [Candidatus Latescibacteria bacterium]|nr:ATP-binding cassette domain-containing protein [Candidatus Latescibacterota bacterium]
FRLRGIDLQVERGEYFALIGPTGSGKTVFLEVLAGLRGVESGRIFLDGREVTYIPPEERRVGLVTQHQDLFPHMSVLENVMYGLKARGIGRREAERRARDVLELLGIGELSERRPGFLSGGERQRVALCRALAIRPDVLLLDEPLSSVDPPLRRSLREELKRTSRKLSLTVLHVTHDREEVFSLAERVGVMIGGKMVQCGRVEDVVRCPVVSELLRT